jgi:ABC-type nitrate/sulfonate/bicarbonate transport system substrate-binding protein
MIARSVALALLCAMIATAVPTQAQVAALPVTVELGDVSATKLPFLVAAQAGIYARNGLDVTQYINPSAAAAAAANGLVVPPDSVKANTVGDLCICGGSPTIVRMTLVANAPQRIILATTDTQQAFHLFVSPGIKRIADLKGKRIGYIVRGDLTDLMFNALAHRMGWDPNRDWSMFSGVDGVDTAAKYKMDAILAAPLARAEALRVGYHDLGDLSRFHFVILGSGVAALKSWLPSHRSTAAAFIKSTVEAIALMKQDKNVTFAAMERFYGLNDPVREQALYDAAIRMPAKPYPSVQGLHLVRKMYTWREMQIHPDSYFIDPSFMNVLR